jgi:hypothetical protein
MPKSRRTNATHRVEFMQGKSRDFFFESKDSQLYYATFIDSFLKKKNFYHLRFIWTNSPFLLYFWPTVPPAVDVLWLLSRLFYGRVSTDLNKSRLTEAPSNLFVGVRTYIYISVSPRQTRRSTEEGKDQSCPRPGGGCCLLDVGGQPYERSNNAEAVEAIMQTRRRRRRLLLTAGGHIGPVHLA